MEFETETEYQLFCRRECLVYLFRQELGAEYESNALRELSTLKKKNKTKGVTIQVSADKCKYFEKRNH